MEGIPPGISGKCQHTFILPQWHRYLTSGLQKCQRTYLCYFESERLAIYYSSLRKLTQLLRNTLCLLKIIFVSVTRLIIWMHDKVIRNFCCTEPGSGPRPSLGGSTVTFSLPTEPHQSPGLLETEPAHASPGHPSCRCLGSRRTSFLIALWLCVSIPRLGPCS